MEKLNVPLDEIRHKSRSEIFELCNKFPYRSQWACQDAFQHAEFVIAMTQGERYEKTRNIKSLVERV